MNDHEKITLGAVTLYRHNYDGEYIQIVVDGKPQQMALHVGIIERAIMRLVNGDIHD